jgi:hypothetical protein
MLEAAGESLSSTLGLSHGSVRVRKALQVGWSTYFVLKSSPYWRLNFFLACRA